jgi:ubiquitin
LRKQIKQRTKGEHTRTILGFNKQARQKEELDKTFFLREELLCCNAIAKATS